MTSSGSSGRKAVFVYDRAGWIGIGNMFFRRSDWTDATPRLPRASPRDDRRRFRHMSCRRAQFLDIGLHRMLGLSVTQPLRISSRA